MVFAATNYFRQDLPQYSNSAVIRLPVPSSSSIEIVKYARSALQSIFRKGYQYKRAGVIINDIINAGTVQGNLFDTTDRAKQAKLMKAVDGVNAIFGRHSVELAASGSPISDNIVKRERLSPCYSTRLSDIINVKLI
jgi:DNA polymerase V